MARLSDSETLAVLAQTLRDLATAVGMPDDCTRADLVARVQELAAEGRQHPSVAEVNEALLAGSLALQPSGLPVVTERPARSERPTANPDAFTDALDYVNRQMRLAVLGHVVDHALIFGRIPEADGLHLGSAVVADGDGRVRAAQGGQQPIGYVTALEWSERNGHTATVQVGHADRGPDPTERDRQQIREAVLRHAAETVRARARAEQRYISRTVLDQLVSSAMNMFDHTVRDLRPR